MKIGSTLFLAAALLISGCPSVEMPVQAESSKTEESNLPCESNGGVCTYRDSSGKAFALADKPCPSNFIQIAIFSQGRVEVNGHEASVAAVVHGLERLTGSGVTVCLHREHPKGPWVAEPWPKDTIEIRDAIVRSMLRGAIYWDAKFQKLVMPVKE